MKRGRIVDYSFDEFVRRQNLIAEYTVHRVLANHGPGERCSECEQILSAAPNREEST